MWPSWRHSPAELKKLENDPAALRAAIDAHITDEAGTLKGQLHDWDVENEPYSNNDFMKVLGDPVQADWFKLARVTDPAAKLYLNDYGILAAGGKDAAHQQHFEDTISLLQKEGRAARWYRHSGPFRLGFDATRAHAGNFGPLRQVSACRFRSPSSMCRCPTRGCRPITPATF